MSEQTARGELELTVSEVAQWSLLAVGGELDVTTSSSLKRALGDASGALGVILDLERVSFIDSTALGVLIGAQKRLAREGRRLRVVVTNPIVVRIIAISGVDELLELRASLDEVLNGA